MSLMGTKQPKWLTFDCYGTLIQWDEGLRHAVQTILDDRQSGSLDVTAFIEAYDRYEHALEQESPFRSFREVSGLGLNLALDAFGLDGSARDAEILTSSISSMPPFPEVVEALGALKAMGYRLCIVSNTDDEIIAGNVAQLGGHIDKVITAQQAGAYKPSKRIFEYTYASLGVSKDEVVHICASPHLDHAAARDMGFRCIWIDRGTGRKLLPNYSPDTTLSTLDQVPRLFTSLGW
ncbi:haloacid dehalogenase type II [Burkholderia sp. Ac-20379]|uniref:haloacid dehalogenase type II n=1 Tax=Burkholderia sp. Ac-20379 TaxID=2703900 RepID=UPI001981D4FC|nr:haloacid dehalogenase type II [Burkholderia sp. Ac-20379]MBN3723690.1 haloacid dehalogenase type II [Burkholderia sp. Ac-20379]